MATDPTSKNERLYRARDTYALSPHFERHMLAMTSEGLTGKAAIARELAYRDAEIERLQSGQVGGVEELARQRNDALREIERLRAMLDGKTLISDDERDVEIERLRAERDILARHIMNQPKGLPDWACGQCVSDPSMIVQGFVCGYHRALALQNSAPETGAKPE